MAQIISVASQKGGVGKTTVALNLAYSLSQLGDRVLLIDTDPQGGATLASNVKRRTDKGLINVLTRSLSFAEATTLTKNGRLSVMGIGTGSHEEVLQMEVWARDGSLRNVLRTGSEPFDYLIIDAPAGIGSLTTALLSASNGVVLVVQPRALSIKTLPSFLGLIRWIRTKANPGLRLDGILVNMFDAHTSLEVELLEDLRGTLPGGALLTTIIPQSDALERASLRAVPVAMEQDGKEMAGHFFNLAVELKQKHILAHAEGDDDEYTSGLF